jgi:hypothetical protein
MWNLLTNFASTDLKPQAQLSYCMKEDWAREISVFAKILNCAKRKGSEDMLVKLIAIWKTHNCMDSLILSHSRH